MLKSRSAFSLILAISLLFALVSMASAEGGKVLKITTHELAYANLYKALKIPADTTVTLQYKIKGEGINGYSWGPGVFLYWDPANYAGIRLNDTIEGSGGLRVDISGARKNEPGKFASPGEWFEVKVVFTITEIFFYVRHNDQEEWTLYYQTERPLTLLYEPTGIVIGVGYKGTNPYLRNSNADIRKVGSVYFDDITLTAGDKVIFKEDFEKTMDELKGGYDIATDPQNEEPVFEIISEGEGK